MDLTKKEITELQEITKLFVQLSQENRLLLLNSALTLKTREEMEKLKKIS